MTERSRSADSLEHSPQTTQRKPASLPDDPAAKVLSQAAPCNPALESICVREHGTRRVPGFVRAQVQGAAQQASDLEVHR